MIKDYRAKSDMLKALAHPIRLRMVEGLVCNECHVDKIVRALGIPQSTASQHLAVLKARGVVEPRKDGVKTCYKVRDPGIIALVKELGR
jgi:ArsR family transcriptional regulator